MYKRILVPTDGSEASRNALIQALGLAEKFNSEVEIFNVTPTSEAFDLAYSLLITQDQINKSGDFVLEATLKGIDIGKVKLLKKHTSGNTAISILDEIKREFDLVVMGTRGHSVLIGAALGSVTQRVLAHAECPVLVVNNKY